jgi:type VI secretion system protein ImpL
VTIKTLFFSLFLYVCLVWVGAFYLQPNDLVHFGLQWTAIGLILVLAFIIGARLFGWWRLWRAKAAVRPAAPVRPAPMAHEDDAALAALIAEANTNLAKAPAYAGKRGTIPLSGMPLYLLIGPEGSGKTSTFVNSGLDPQLLAGQVAGTGPPMPTRLCNLWVAKGAIFAELSGRAFSGDPARWTQLLRVLRGGASVPMWRRLWREPEQGFALHGAIAFSDGKEFTGTPNTQALERRTRDLQERLRAVGEVFGVDFPVYQVIAKCDAIPFFADFFRRLPEPEANQVWGCTLPLRAPGGAEVSAEEQAKRITRSFRPLYQELAKRRITQLAHEPDPARRPAVYEFPRELKRIRTPLIQFLSETFRPHPLRLGPLLRGYYLTGVREVEVAAANMSETRADWSLQKSRMDTTRLFSAADATRIFRPEDTGMIPKAGGRGALVPRWMFASDLFSNVILADRTVPNAAAVDPRVELYRRGIFAGACGLCLLLCLAFLWSSTRNLALLGDVRAADMAIEQQPGKMPTLAELGALDDLRNQVRRLIDLDHSRPVGMRWGLYSGDRVLDEARLAYFRRFQDLLLNNLNAEIVARLQKMPATPAEDAPYDPTYRLLQTHLMMAGSCDAEPQAVTQVLTDVRREIKLAAGAGEPELANRQIQFYADELPHQKPPLWRLTENADARDGARRYLQNIKGIDRIYRNILSNAESKLAKPPGLGALAPKYAEVLKGPPEPSGAFAQANWDFMQSAFKKNNTAASGDPCVVGSSSDGGASGTQDAQVAGKLRSMFIADYVKRWRSFVQGYSVAGYSGPEDAARKLQILADYKSPLLALFFLTGTQTNFPATAEESTLEKVGQKVPIIGKMISGKKKADQAAQKTGLAETAPKEMSPADITQTFQPVHWVVPPAGDAWVGDKNSAYIQALADLGQSMQAIAGNKLDPAVQQDAQQKYDKAMQAAQQIERGFRSVGEDGLDSSVQNLLEQPIRYTKSFINTDVDKVTAGQINGELRKLCLGLSGTLRKYPFQPSSKEEIGIEELARWFAPGGAIWQFQAKSLGDLTVKDGSQWRTKDPAKKPQVTQEMLSFLNQAQAIADVFYPGGAAQSLVYSLRPKMDSSNLKDWTLTLIIDGQKADWTPTSSLQKQFTWPAAAGKDPGALGRIGTGAGGLSAPFASRGGLWGIFKIMGDAETRAPSQKVVEWKYLRSGDGRSEPLQPPVRLEIVAFPNGVDVFNARFFQSLRCPLKAVQ